jgi:predicted glycoside hydrolase/deacetylase ChbG (UPF0249 family)
MADLPLAVWAHMDYRFAAAHSVLTPQFVGRAMTGVMTADSLAAALRRLRAGHTELMVHPGYLDDALRQLPTRLLGSRVAEVELLTSPAIRHLVADEHVRLDCHDERIGLSSQRSYRHAS